MTHYPLERKDAIDYDHFTEEELAKAFKDIRVFINDPEGFHDFNVEASLAKVRCVFIDLWSRRE